MTFASPFSRVIQRPFGGVPSAGGGWWDLDGAIASCVAAYAPKGAADYATSKVNLVLNAAYDCVDGTAYPTWNTATGWTFNGTTQFLSPNLYPTESMTAIVRFANATGNGSSGYPALFGSSESNRNFYIHPRSLINRRYYLHGADGQGYITGSLTSGVIALAGNTPYLNGSAETLTSGTIGGWVGTSTVKMTIGKRSNGAFFAGDIIAIAFYSATITAPQVAALTTAMNAL